MGWVQEIVDLFGKLSFYTIVHEWEQGLYIRRGRVIEKTIKRDRGELEEIVQGERRVADENGGRLGLFFDRKKPLPEGYGRGVLTGQPVDSKRYEKQKVLMPGFYWNIPILDDIIVRPQQEIVLNLGNVAVPTVDEENTEVNVSCNIRYELWDLEKAFVAVHDYEQSLRDHALSILAKSSRGRTYEQWKTSSVVEELEEQVKKDLEPVVTEEWGLKIYKVYVTSNVRCNVQSVFLEANGSPHQLVPIVNPQQRSE